MNVVHRTTIVAKCPKGCDDVYSAEFHATTTVMVEEIASTIKLVAASATTQEDLTQRLATLTDCKVVTVGRHNTSEGSFETTVEADPESD